MTPLPTVWSQLATYAATGRSEPARRGEVRQHALRLHVGDDERRSSRRASSRGAGAARADAG